MDDSHQRELAGLRALLDKHGPAQVIGALGLLCVQALESGAVAGDDVDQWACVATGAQDVARAALAGEDAPMPSGPGASFDGAEEVGGAEESDGEAFGTGSDEESHGEGSPASESAAPTASGELGDDVLPSADEREEERHAAPEVTATSTSEETMAKDSRLGQRSSEATHWKCARWNGTAFGDYLMFGEGNVRTDEWTVRSCSTASIFDRWGPGLYVVQYLRFDEKGRRRPCGRSQKIDLIDPSPTTSEPAPASAPPVAPAPLPPMISPYPATVLAPGGGGGDAMFTNVFSLMTYLNEQSERTRAAAASESRAAIERANLEAKLALERYKADREFELERMRLESAEKLAAIQANAKFAHRAGGAAAFDPDTLAAKIGEVVGTQLRAHREEEEEDYEDPPAPPPPAPPPPPPDAFSKLVDMLGPFMPLLMTLAQTKAAESAAAARGERVGYAAE